MHCSPIFLRFLLLAVAICYASPPPETWWSTLAREWSATLTFHAPGTVFASGAMQWSREDGKAGTGFKLRFTRHLAKPQVGPNYTMLVDELIEASTSPGINSYETEWTSLVFGVKCLPAAQDMALFPHLRLLGERERLATEGGACSNVLAVRRSEGNITFCLGSNGVPQKLDISLSPGYAGGTNAQFYAISATFSNISLGPLPAETFAWPGPCLESPPPASCPFDSSSPTEVVTAVHFTHKAGMSCGLNNLMTNDLRGALTFGLEGPYEYLQVYNVTVHKGFAPIQDCNYKPDRGQMVCLGGNRTPANAKSVGRSSEAYMEGQYEGQCSENALIGSWFSFPSEGECASGWDVGFSGCKWKTEAFKVVTSKCVATRCALVQAPNPQALPCLAAAIAACPDQKGSMGSTCYSKPIVLV